ncbi:hypothetical protein C9374_005413 [Naegleria lovaniensis]|uniref:Uncharacterized protein n=1 Tax=Naegleria lovaniensis TaxID=51637 RepID=A0AA88GN18_NAELO|nr:uncharacterized protein C9374_005413 [Naegleria lovaniensis]KAG2382211.1 hypothetical protein C9374_005413 [Naegleria lovaniensis]
MIKYFRCSNLRRKVRLNPSITAKYLLLDWIVKAIIIVLLVFGHPSLNHVQGLSLHALPLSSLSSLPLKNTPHSSGSATPRTVFKSSVQYQPMYTGMKVKLVGRQTKYFYIQVNDTERSDQQLVFTASVISSTKPDNRFSLSIDVDSCVITSSKYPINADLNRDNYQHSALFQNCKNIPYMYVDVSSDLAAQEYGKVQFGFEQKPYSDNTIIITIPSFLVPLLGLGFAAIVMVYAFVKKKMRQTINKIVDESQVPEEDDGKVDEKKKHKRDKIAHDNSHKNNTSQSIPPSQPPSAVTSRVQVTEVNQKGIAPPIREVVTNYSNEGIVNYVQPHVYQQQQHVIDQNMNFQPPIPYPIQNDNYIPQPIFNPIGMQGDYPPPPYPNTMNQAGMITSTTTTTVLVGPPIGDNNLSHIQPLEP